MKFKRLIIVAAAIFAAAAILVFMGCKLTDTEIVDETFDGQKGTGTNNGYFWTLYTEGGSSSISFGSGGNYSISYSNVNDVVGGKGWNPGSSSRVIGYNVGSLSGSYNFVGVYGWTTNPLIEYYVAEMGSSAGGTYCGSVSSDGHSYGVYKQQRVNAPSIQGTQTFWQYKSSWGGSSTGSNRNVTMANHFNAWRSMCGSYGSQNYQVFALEAWGGKSGYINATTWDAGSSSGSSGSTTTTTSTSSSSGSSVSGTKRLKNRGTGLFLDGMGRTNNGADVGQYANTTHNNAYWTLTSAGSGYYYLVNRGTNMKLDGYGRTSNGSACAQYSSSTTHPNAQWSFVSAGSGYYYLVNRGTNMKLDGYGRTSNGSACAQYSSSTTHPNAQWQLVD